MINEKTEEYNESSIESYENCAAIRERPTMYIEELGRRGVFRLKQEVIGNCIDEWLAGSCNLVKVYINENENKFIVTDDARGIPLGKAIDCATKIHTGGKFKSKAYKFKIGQNGVGLTAVNALSIFMSLEIHRDNKKFYVEFSRGVITSGPTITNEPNQKVTGTTVTFIPDEIVFGDITVQSSIYQDYIDKLVHINSGFKVDFTADLHNGKKIHEVYYSKNGLVEYLNETILKGHKPILQNPIEIPTTIEDVNVYLGKSKDPKTGVETEMYETRAMGISVAFNWCEDLRDAKIMSFVNGIETINDGYHVSGFRSGIADVIRTDLRDGGFIAKKDPLYDYVGRDDYFEGIVAMLDAKHEKPLFDGQTKNKFSSSDYEPFVRKVVAAKFKEWTELNPTRYKLVISQILLSAKARMAASKARNMIKGVASVSGTALTAIEKFTACRSKVPEECELFFVEGDSAGGSAKSGGDMRFQAIYKTTGKPSNVYGKNIIEKLLAQGSTSEIKDMVTIMRCGFGSTFDITKLAYNKLIIMADADPDGGHISSLLLGFFFRYYSELIVAGKVFVANPPLYKFTFKNGKYVYITTMDEYYRILDSTIMEEFDICAVDFKTKKVSKIKSKSFYKVFLNKLRGYATYVESIGMQTNINPELLEFILVHCDEIIKHKKAMINKNIMDVAWSDEHQCYVVEGVYDNVYHKIELNQFFHKLCKGLIEKINDVKWSNLVLKHRKNGTYLGPSLYKMSHGMEYLISHNANVQRFKGLGEMNPNQLWETTMNPKTRTLTKVTMDMNKYDEYTKWLDLLIGENIDGRKEYYRQYL